MSAANVHYEIHGRKARSAPWRVLGATEDRAEAIAIAQRFFATNAAGAAFVTKEAFDSASGQFGSVRIHASGECNDRPGSRLRDPNAEATPMCLSPADLHKPEARRMMTRLLDRWLTRNEILPGELLYRADLVSKLDGSGMEISHAIQLAAMARSPDDDTLHAVVRRLHDIVDQAASKLYADARYRRLPRYDEGGLAAVAERARRDKTVPKACAAAVADRLSRCIGWVSKLETLVDLWEEAGDVGDDAEAVRAHIETLVHEWTLTGEAMRTVYQGCVTPGDRLRRLLSVLGALDDPLDGSAGAVRAVLKRSKSKLLRATLLERAFDLIVNGGRLEPSSFEAELDLVRMVADRLIAFTADTDDDISAANPEREAVADVFARRSMRMLALNDLDQWLGEASPPERILKLLTLERELVGANARMRLGQILAGEIDCSAFSSFLLNDSASTLERLRMLKGLHDAIAGSRLAKSQKETLGRLLDSAAATLIRATRPFERIAGATPDPLKAAAAILTLARRDLTPVAANEAIRIARALLQSEAAREALGRRPEAMGELAEMIREAGEKAA